MKSEISSWLIIRLLLRSGAVFEELSDTRSDPHVVFFRYLIWLAAIPPVFAYIGASNFGWRLGAVMVGWEQVPGENGVDQVAAYVTVLGTAPAGDPPSLRAQRSNLPIA